jgi:magnesium transporter
MISIYHYNSNTQEGHWQDRPCLPNTRAIDLPQSDLIWIDLDNPSLDEEAYVFDQFLPVHPLTREDITKPRREPEQGVHFPKVEEFQEYLFVIVNPLRPEILESGKGKSKKPLPRGRSSRFSVQLSAVMVPNVLITHHLEHLPSVEHVKQSLFRHKEQASRGPDYVFHLILDALVDDYAPIVDRIGDRLDLIESKLFGRFTPDLMRSLLRQKRLIVALRKTLILEREVLALLTRGEFRLVDSREIAYYRNVYDHLARYTELIEGARERVSDLMQTHLSAMSNRLNSIMKTLAMISTLILPMTLVSGIYGMNFQHIPEIHTEWGERWGYPFALITMSLVGLGTLLFFKWRKWF